MKPTAKLAFVAASFAMVLGSSPATAGTRAESSPVAVDISRGTESVVDQNELKGRHLWLLLLLAAIIAAILAGSGGGGGRTRG
ncbi:hypothetical protein A6F68_00882 [Tsuneonella dongtanensis]|uniref:Uncharacterized protein n=1 Tax=Tsuneonella dongtanensis TaxID=692370 RepID=A0A1B2ABE7_9SPHN|nr:hypothetical protein [Tsuneonella dongtanensis]ANY19408.1 hypothetical protein A6F68_00882 [Tsuneonella dongtanensis]